MRGRTLRDQSVFSSCTHMNSFAHIMLKLSVINEKEIITHAEVTGRNNGIQSKEAPWNTFKIVDVSPLITVTYESFSRSI